MPLQRAEVGLGFLPVMGLEMLALSGCFHGMQRDSVSSFAAPGISVQQVEVGAVLVT